MIAMKNRLLLVVAAQSNETNAASIFGGSAQVYAARTVSPWFADTTVTFPVDTVCHVHR